MRWLLVAAIAYTLAMTIWVFFETPVSMPIDSSSPRPSQSEVSRAPVNVNWILSQHLFGEAGAQSPDQAQGDEPLVQTRLPLVLQGVSVSDIPDDSSAIVAQKGKPGRFYKIGDDLPGNAKLVEVTPDRIFLRRAGVKETLLFPKSKGKGLTTQVVDPGDEEVPTSNNRTVSNINPELPADDDEDIDSTIDNYRQQFSEDAESALADLGIEATDEGGYRIGSAAQSPVLQQAGLQSGDLILSVNGQSVGDVQQDQLQLDNILAQGSARIEIQRGSRRFFITANLPNRR